MKKLILGTYNVQHCSDNTVPFDENNRPVVRVDKTAQMLKKMKVDIIGLNEVYDKGPGEEYCHQTEKLADYFGTDQYVFGLGKEFEWKDIIGNAVLSRYKIVDSEIIHVPAPAESERSPEEKEWFEDRVIVKTIIDIGRQICFISTHFGLNKSEQERMCKKITQILDEVNMPCVLCGDFNVSPDSEYLKPIYERMNSAAEVMGKKNVLTWSSFNPKLTLDYIFFSKEFKVLNFEVVDEILSDHRPLWAELELR